MNLITEEFQGADLARLNDCIKAIHKAGLAIGKHTQAGINQSSGNVWVWDEDWVGCVYCSLGFDVSWCYNCPECNTDTDFVTYQEMEEFVKSHDYNHCESCIAV